jgi:hypothetical protein
MATIWYRGHDFDDDVQTVMTRPIMNTNESIEQLRDELRAAYEARRFHLEQRRVGTANKLHDRALRILRQVRLQAGSEYANIVREWMQDSDDELCVLVAADGLWELPLEAEAILLKISKNGGFVATCAHYVLVEWKGGTLIRPTDVAV